MRYEERAIHRMMRLGIMGPAGSGKTVLARRLSQSLGLPLVPEGVRARLNQYGMRDPWALSWSEQIELQRWFLNYKCRCEEAIPSFVSDRTTLDTAVSLRLRCPGEGALVLVQELVLRAVEHAKRTYTAVVILQGRYEAEHDGVRCVEPSMIGREAAEIEHIVSVSGVDRICAVAQGDRGEADRIAAIVKSVCHEH